MKDERLKALELLLPTSTRSELDSPGLRELLAKAEVLAQYINQGIGQPVVKEVKSPTRRRRPKGPVPVE